MGLGLVAFRSSTSLSLTEKWGSIFSMKECSAFRVGIRVGIRVAIRDTVAGPAEAFVGKSSWLGVRVELGIRQGEGVAWSRINCSVARSQVKC